MVEYSDVKLLYLLLHVTNSVFMKPICITGVFFYSGLLVCLHLFTVTLCVAGLSPIFSLLHPSHYYFILL